jgi:hypothetical protein
MKNRKKLAGYSVLRRVKPEMQPEGILEQSGGVYYLERLGAKLGDQD